ncbi:54S ribosomal protein L3 mitochondrial [Tilletia horrida]|uniref:Large ribosomal subunit protein mL44 n=1 Tax=Tilletia horrida TaxID=155126 RepID=A0AAN6GTF2_9BASI|nr:54S ribosomal protein L3 mitochondrial [Tilletia horrida]
MRAATAAMRAPLSRPRLHLSSSSLTSGSRTLPHTVAPIHTRTLATSASARSSAANTTPAIHLPTLARLSPTAYNALRPIPISSVAALAARLHPSFLPRLGANAENTDKAVQTRARRLELVQRALTHPSWHSLWESTTKEFPQAFASDATAALGAGRGVVVEDLGTVRGISTGEGEGPANLNALLEDPRSRNKNVQSVLLASSQYLPLPIVEAGKGGSAGEKFHNASLANLGNSLLGLFASEHLHLRFPHIPTRVLKQAVASYVGPTTASDVALELGLQKSLVRWDPSKTLDAEQSASATTRALVKANKLPLRTEAGLAAALDDQVRVEKMRRYKLAIERAERRRKGFTGAEGDLQSVMAQEGEEQLRAKDVFASVMRALVGVIYQELGVSAARHFVSSHFLTRLVDLPNMIKSDDPKRVLSETLGKYKLAPPQSRLIAETGRLSIHPIFVVGIWSDQNKIGEGSGSSMRMAEFRAAEDALRRLYLAESDPSTFHLPSLTFSDGASTAKAQQVKSKQSLPTTAFVSQPLGRSEVVHGSRARA